MFHLRTIAQRLLLPLLFVSGVAAGLTACSDDDENAAIPKEEPNENEDSVRTVDVSFDLSLSAIDTRADETTTTTTDSTEYLNGTYAENCIDKTKLFFYTFKDNSHGYDDIWTAKKYGGTRINSANVLKISTFKKTGQNTYKVYGKLTLPNASDVSDCNNKFKIMVVANWPNWEENSISNCDATMLSAVTKTQGSITTVPNSCYKYTYNETTKESYTPSTDNLMPMYGVKTFDLNNFSNTKPNDLGTIQMLRSMAKVIVKCTKGDIENIVMTSVNQEGRCAPFSMYSETCTPTEDYTPSSNLTDESKKIWERNNANVMGVYTATGGYGLNNDEKGGGYSKLYSDVPFKKVSDNKYVIYVPEYINNPLTELNPNTGYEVRFPATAVIPARIKINFKGDDKDYYVDFKKEQDDNVYFSILRNHMYVFTVKYLQDEYLYYYVEDFSALTAGKITFK
jgi:hypothetical protein